MQLYMLFQESLRIRIDLFSHSGRRMVDFMRWLEEGA